jgi:hypothetical protein
MKDHYNWWTPAGWERGPEPPELAERNIFACELELLLWVGPNDKDAPHLEVRRGQFGIWVIVWGYDDPIGECFVAERHQAAFTVTRLPALVAMFGGGGAIVEVPEELAEAVP